MTDITGTLARLWGARQKVWPMGKRRQRELEKAMRVGHQQHEETSESERASKEVATRDRFFGLENYGNTCFCSSITQSLYFIDPFREAMLNYKEGVGLAVVVAGSKRRKRRRRKPSREKRDHFTMSLAELFSEISTQKHVTGSVAPAEFIAKLRESNAQYCVSLSCVTEVTIQTDREREREYSAFFPPPTTTYTRTHTHTCTHTHLGLGSPNISTTADA